MEYNAAVPLRPERSIVGFMISGLITTFWALVGVYLLATKTNDFNVMGWYADYIIPAGAILVGLVASSGYGLYSWFTGRKITKSLLWKVVAIQVVAYFAAQYIEFRNLHLIHIDDRTQVGFVEYFDAMARSFAWKQHDGSFGQPMGIWGYAFRFLEIIGFYGGSLIVPAVLRKAPYCQGCEIYMRTKNLSLIPASVPHKKIKKSDVAGRTTHEAEQAQAFEQGKAAAAAFDQQAAQGKPTEFVAGLQKLAPQKKQTGKLLHRIALDLVSCPHCQSGYVRSTLVSGQGKQMRRVQIGTTPVRQEFVQFIRPRR